MPRKLNFNDFLNLDNPNRGRGRGRGRGGGGGRGGRGGFGGGGFEGGGGGRGRGGGLGFGGGGRGNTLGGRGGRGGYRGGRGGGSFGADYTNMALDYGRVNASRYTRAAQYLNSDPDPNAPNAPNTQNENRPPQPRIKSFAPHGPPKPALPALTPGTSTANSGTATPITSGLGFHRNANSHRATRVREGVTYWGGGGAPLFVKAGELFKEGEVDVVKQLGDTLIVETYPLSDPSAPQMRDLHDDTEIEMAAGVPEDIILGAIERAHAIEHEEEEETVLQWNDLVDEDEQHEVDESIVIEVTPEDAEIFVTETITEQVIVAETAALDEVVVAETTIVDEVIITDTVEGPIGTVTEAFSPASPSSETDQALETVTEGAPALVAIAVVESNSDGADEDEDSDEDMEEDEDDIDEDEFTRAADEALFAIDTTGTNGPDDDALFVVDTVGAVSDDALFVVDTGSNSAIPVSAPVYDSPSSAALGADRTPKAATDESIVFRPRLITDPVSTASPASSSRPPAATNFELTNIYVDPRVTMNRKDKKAAKKAKRARNKRSKRRGNGGYELHPRDDSDIDWGSDGPPAKIVGVRAASGDELGDEVDALGSVLAGTDLDVELGAEADVDPDIDVEAMAAFGRSMGLGFGRAGGAGGSAMVEIESDSDEWEGKGRARRFDSVDPWGEEDDSDSDSEDDSDDDLDETADFAALTAAYDEDEDDDEDNEDAGLFAGHQAWKNDEDEDDDDDDDENEANWFLQSMEDALDSGVMSKPRKDRKAVFRSIEQGDFALPTAPAKKSKRGAHVPPDLHAQWEQDRQKKAEKKQARELERVLGLLSSKKKGKKGSSSKLLDAAAIAHLIPRSAAEVADIFDIDSDTDDGGWKVGSGSGTPRRNLLLPKTLDDINEDIQLFLKDAGRTSLPLPPMDKDARKKVHVVAECYGLKSKSKGKGAARFPVLIKLSRSGLKDEIRLQRLLAAARKRGSGAFFSALGGKKKGDKSLAAAFVRGTGASARAREGELVGEGAEKIGNDNIGHRLLSMMGWSEGASIGRPGTSGGLDVPIVAVVKNTKSGLGA